MGAAGDPFPLRGGMIKRIKEREACVKRKEAELTAFLQGEIKS